MWDNTSISIHRRHYHAFSIAPATLHQSPLNYSDKLNTQTHTDREWSNPVELRIYSQRSRQTATHHIGITHTQLLCNADTNTGVNPNGTENWIYIIYMWLICAETYATHFSNLILFLSYIVADSRRWKHLKQQHTVHSEQRNENRETTTVEKLYFFSHCEHYRTKRGRHFVFRLYATSCI